MYAQLDRWHLWWEWKRFYWMSHFVFYFGLRPKIYEVFILCNHTDVKSIKCDTHSYLSVILIKKSFFILFMDFFLEHE